MEDFTRELTPGNTKAAALSSLAKSVAKLNTGAALPARVVADLVTQAKTIASDETFAEKCVDFVRNLAAKSTLDTYTGRDFVQLIEAAYNITNPEKPVDDGK